MRDIRIRQIVRLQKLAQPFLKRKHDENLEWMWTVYGAANHAAVLAFLIRYGNPRIDEPLSGHVSGALTQLRGRIAAANSNRSGHRGPNIWAFSRLVRFGLTIWIVSKLSVRRFDTL